MIVQWIDTNTREKKRLEHVTKIEESDGHIRLTDPTLLHPLVVPLETDLYCWGGTS